MRKLLLSLTFMALLTLMVVPTHTFAQGDSVSEPSATTEGENLACNGTQKTMTGSYKLVPSDPNSPRIYYEVRYTVRSNQSICNISDRVRGTPLGDEPMRRVKGCINGANGCTSIQDQIPLNGGYTSWRTLTGESLINNYYRNYASGYGGSPVAYGYRQFK